MKSSSPRHEFDYVEKRSCLRTQFSCLCGTGTCRLCCRYCPIAKESTITRAVYIIFMVVYVIIMALLMSPEVQEGIIKIFPDNVSVCKWLGAGNQCQAGHLIGYLAVYRVGLAMALYHIILMLGTCGVKSSKGCQGSLHNGLWIYKIMLLICVTVGVFMIPDYRDQFINVWMYISMVGGAAFIVIQLILLVFMVHKWTDLIEKRVENGGSRAFWFSIFSPILSSSIIGLSICGMTLLYIYFAAEEGCHKNQWFILINAFGCFLVTFVSAVRKNAKPLGLRLLHASLITFYVVYLTWMAVTSAPRSFQRFTRPSAFGPGNYPKFTKPFYQDYYCGPNQNQATWLDKVSPFINFAVTLISIVFGSLGISEAEKCNALELPGCPPLRDENTDREYDIEDIGGQRIIRNEKKSVLYSYSLFHAMMTLACLLMMMHLTHWHTPTGATFMTFGRSWASVWIKMGTSWVCLLIYLVTVLCPSFLPSIPSIIHSPFKERSPSFPVIEMNGNVIDNVSEIGSCASEEAVPLNRVLRPTFIGGTHLETTV